MRESWTFKSQTPLLNRISFHRVRSQYYQVITSTVSLLWKCLSAFSAAGEFLVVWWAGELALAPQWTGYIGASRNNCSCIRWDYWRLPRAAKAVITMKLLFWKKDQPQNIQLSQILYNFRHKHIDLYLIHNYIRYKVLYIYINLSCCNVWAGFRQVCIFLKSEYTIRKQIRTRWTTPMYHPVIHSSIHQPS